MRRIVWNTVALAAFAGTMGGAVNYWRRNPRVGTAFMNSVVNPGLIRRGLAGAGASEIGTLERSHVRHSPADARAPRADG